MRAASPALDFSPIYIDYASQAIRDPRITFKVGDICALPFADRSFDRVLSLLVLHFVPQTERAVAELRRVARPGATVAAAVWDVRGGYVANRMFYDTAAAFDDEGRKRRAQQLYPADDAARRTRSRMARRGLHRRA